TAQALFASYQRPISSSSNLISRLVAQVI
ncbi:MAG: hypothetical protein ACI9XU_002207, partial [Arenicella sp.]